MHKYLRIHTYLIFFLLFWVLPFIGYSQITIKSDSTRNVSLQLYAEPYYTIDIAASSAKKERLPFLYNHHISRRPEFNLAFAKLQMQHNHFRSNVGFMYGSYATYNLQSEPTFFRYIYEANVGVKLSKQQAIWLDAGVLPSHIGSEVAKGNNNATLTRSIIAENSPYFESGMQLSFSNKKNTWYTALLLTNGWQRIRWVKDESYPCLGLQVTHKSSKNLLFNYSYFLGRNGNSLRQYHDLYFTYTQDAMYVSFTIDMGTSNAIYKKQMGIWYGWSMVMQYKLTPYLDMAIRNEYFQDPEKLVASTDNLEGKIKIYGASYNIDFHITRFASWRNEIKYYYNFDPIFSTNTSLNRHHNISFCSSFCIDL